MSSRLSASGGEGSGPGRDSSIDDGVTGSYSGRHTSSLRPETGPEAWGRRSESSEGLGFADSEMEVDFSKRSPRRDRRRTSVGGTRENSRSTGPRMQNQPMVADFYSSNMPWIPAVIEFAKRLIIFLYLQVNNNNNKFIYFNIASSIRIE